MRPHLDYPSAEAVPPATEIAALAINLPVLLVSYGTVYEVIAPGYPMTRSPDDAFEKRLKGKLSLLLSNHSVFHSGGGIDQNLTSHFYWVDYWRYFLPRSIRPANRVLPVGRVFSGYSRLTLLRVIDREIVLAHADAIVASARLFREIATDLAGRLAVKLKVPIEAFANPIVRREIDPRGKLHIEPLDAEWTFCFHGFQCGFRNTRTGQDLEINLGFLHEFGVLDPYFFAKFLRTTPELKPVADLFTDDYHDPRRALDILEAEGRLTRVVGTPWGRHERMGLVALPE